MLATGASVSPAILRLRGRLEGLSLAVRPGAAAAVLGIPAAELTGAVIPLHDLWRGEETGLLERMAEAPDDSARVGLLLEAMRRRLGRHHRWASDANRRAAIHAAQLLAGSGGRHSLQEVAQTIGVGERRLQQIFKLHVGVSPRAWSRLARLHACLRALRGQPAPRWADVAVASGFYDQSHLVNEFKALCGMPPRRFLECFVSGSSKTAGPGATYPRRRSQGERRAEHGAEA